MEHSYHLPVLMQPVLDALQVKPDGVYVDGTAGVTANDALMILQCATGKIELA